MSFEVEVPGGSTVRLPTAGKYCDRDIVVSAVENQLMEVHRITVANDLTSASATFLLTNNQFVADHWDDTGFMIQLVPLNAIASGYGSVYAFNGNREIMNNGSSKLYGSNLHLNLSGGIGVSTANKNSSGGNYDSVPFVDSTRTGIATINNTTSGTLKAGDYLLILSVAEV